jgi:hypothetical protein
VEYAAWCTALYLYTLLIIMRKCMQSSGRWTCPWCNC